MTVIHMEAHAVTSPGVVDGMSEALYFADPVPSGSLSSTGARKLLPPSCPALFRYEADHGTPNRTEFDIGHAAHARVLGVGAPLEIVDAPDWRTKAARAARDQAYGEGRTPILKEQHEHIAGMADALAAHPVASELFSGDGKPEQSLFWFDDRHGVWRRARFDWLPETVDGRLIIPDYKTTTSAEPGAIRKTVANLRYHQQAAFYVDGALALGLADAVGFLLVFQEKTPPYLVTVAEFDQEALGVGRALNDRALEVFAECQATGEWPGYTTDIETVSLPDWALRDFVRSDLA